MPLIQAAIGSVSLDMARQKDFTGQTEEEFGIQVLIEPSLEIVVINLWSDLSCTSRMLNLVSFNV